MSQKSMFQKMIHSYGTLYGLLQVSAHTFFVAFEGTTSLSSLITDGTCIATYITQYQVLRIIMQIQTVIKYTNKMMPGTWK